MCVKHNNKYPKYQHY